MEGLDVLAVEDTLVDCKVAEACTQFGDQSFVVAVYSDPLVAAGEKEQIVGIGVGTDSAFPEASNREVVDIDSGTDHRSLVDADRSLEEVVVSMIVVASVEVHNLPRTGGYVLRLGIRVLLDVSKHLHKGCLLRTPSSLSFSLFCFALFMLGCCDSSCSSTDSRSTIRFSTCWVRGW